MPDFKSILFRFIRSILAIIKPISIGVRVMLIQNEQVLLVRHTYQNGWFMPGGGAKPKETLEDSARREAREEAGAELGKLRLVGIYTNLSEGRADHIALFLCEDFTYTGQHDREIAELRAFHLNALPAELYPGHQRRMEEYKNQISNPFGHW